jgi:hypothetical protein
VLPLDRIGNGSLAAFAGIQAGWLHLVIDVGGYFAPLLIPG